MEDHVDGWGERVNISCRWYSESGVAVKYECGASLDSDEPPLPSHRCIQPPFIILSWQYNVWRSFRLYHCSIIYWRSPASGERRPLGAWWGFDVDSNGTPSIGLLTNPFPMSGLAVMHICLFCVFQLLDTRIMHIINGTEVIFSFQWKLKNLIW